LILIRIPIWILGDAQIEQGDDPEVIRAKYFIRDEFLVSCWPTISSYFY
jgi:hypothetical protein